MAWIRATNIAERMSDLRDAMGWDQADVAKLVDRTWQTVSDWERGLRPPPSKVLTRLAREQGWPITIFTEGGPMPASIVNSAVNNRPREVMERGATYRVGSPTGEPAAPEGTDPARETGAMLAASILADGAKRAKQLLDAGRLDDAVMTLWRIIGAAQRELRDGGMEGGGPAPEPAPEPRRPRVTSTDLAARKRKLKGARGMDDPEEED